MQSVTTHQPTDKIIWNTPLHFIENVSVPWWIIKLLFSYTLIGIWTASFKFDQHRSASTRQFDLESSKTKSSSFALSLITIALLQEYVCLAFYFLRWFIALIALWVLLNFSLFVNQSRVRCVHSIWTLYFMGLYSVITTSRDVQIWHVYI